MINDFNYNDVPPQYLHCQHAPCPLADQCLRFRAWQNVTPDTPDFRVLNPAFVAAQAQCGYFKPCAKARYARGMSRLLDNLPHQLAVDLKKKLRAEFQKNTFYRIANKERLIAPDEQARIRQLLQQVGIMDEAEFDEYVEQYIWS